MAQVTRLWVYGGPGHLFGSFSGKVDATVIAAILTGFIKSKIIHPIVYRLRLQFK